jgi:hypothetical protein
VRGIGGEPREGIGGGDCRDLVDPLERTGGECSGGGAGSNDAHETGGGVGSGTGVAAKGVEVDLLAGSAGVIAGDGKTAVRSGEYAPSVSDWPVVTAFRSGIDALAVEGAIPLPP